MGDIIPGTDNARFQIQRPDIRVRDPQKDAIIESIRSDVPDLLSLHGKWTKMDTISGANKEQRIST